MQIVCNGHPQTLDNGATIDDLLRTLQLKPDTVIAEINQRIIDQNEYATQPLQDGDTVELIRFVGGG